MKRTDRSFLTPAEAGRALGVSYPTIKQWIYRRRIRSARTPGGHHRIPRSEIERLAGGPLPRGSGEPPLSAISGRNKLLGRVARVRISGLLAEVTLEIGSQTLTAIITSAAAKQLGLKAGVGAYALIKATEVMMIRA